MTTDGLENYVTYREHIAAKEETQKRQSAVEMEVAHLRTALMHLPDDVRKLTEAVQGLASKMPSQTGGANDALARSIDGQSLAIQRMFDAMQKQIAVPVQPTTATELLKLLNTPPPGSSGKTWALVGVLATVAAFLAWQSFSG